MDVPEIVEQLDLWDDIGGWYRMAYQAAVDPGSREVTSEEEISVEEVTSEHSGRGQFFIQQPLIRFIHSIGFRQHLYSSTPPKVWIDVIQQPSRRCK